MLGMLRSARQPSVLTASVCSLVLHAGAFTATYYWHAAPVRRFSLTGQRQAISVEASFARQERPVEVEIDVKLNTEEPARREEWVEPVRAPTPEPPTRELQVARRPSAFTIERPAAELPLRREINDEAAVARAERAPRPTNQVKVPRLQQSKPRPPVRPPRLAAPLIPTVVVPQIVGVDDRQRPDLSGNRPPSYPVVAIRQQLEGTVLLCLHIARTGEVERVEVSESSGHAVLDRAAVAAVSRWRGQPAQQAGRPVATVEWLPIRFRLN